MAMQFMKQELSPLDMKDLLKRLLKDWGNTELANFVDENEKCKL